MVISFSVDEARSQLMTYGYVYTYRKRKRAKDHEVTWWNVKRGRRSMGKVSIALALVVDNSHIETQLRPYVSMSGFPYIEQWIDAIKALHGRSSNKTLGAEGYLYKVTLVGGTQ